MTARTIEPHDVAQTSDTAQTHDTAETAARPHIEAVDEGNFEAMAACFAVPGSILDGLAAYLWHGPEAHPSFLGKWRIAARASAKRRPSLHG